MKSRINALMIALSLVAGSYHKLDFKKQDRTIKIVGDINKL